MRAEAGRKGGEVRAEAGRKGGEVRAEVGARCAKVCTRGAAGSRGRNPLAAPARAAPATRA
ncbi:hypothetical protein [Brevibacterium oceani]|uniref:hypothetical protein n=1 Tax=Brevibacterium oceani TaxID=358099 RepID=UPI001B31D65B|nr:hypothetical protein [Brevibacterium oceani]